MKIILLVILFIVLFFVEKESYVNYPTMKEIEKVWNNCSYFKEFTSLDKSARNIPQNTDFKDVINIYKKSIKPLTKNDKKIIEEKLQKLHKYNFFNDIPWKIVKFHGIENNYPHTHGDIIFLPTDFFQSDIDIDNTLIHEKIHVLQRLFPQKFKKLYNQWGFNQQEKQNYHYLTRSNPDDNNTYWLWKDKSDLVAYYNENPNDITDIKYKIVKNNRIFDTNPEYSKFFKLNNNHYHVNELSAELLSRLVMGQLNNSEAMNILSNLYLKNLKS